MFWNFRRELWESGKGEQPGWYNIIFYFLIFYFFSPPFFNYLSLNLFLGNAVGKREQKELLFQKLAFVVM